MTAKKKSSPKLAKPARRFGLIRNVVPDKIDLRDRVYQPTVALVPGPKLEPKYNLPVLNQEDTNACTGFALASVVDHVQRAAKRPPAECRVSPFMLYSMARRYDEFPGDPGADTGSSLRGAMKGWYKHGACAYKLWISEPMPVGKDVKPEKDWWLDAVRRPLGAYYRIDSRSVTDMHVALNEVGILYASAVCHSGWDKPIKSKNSKYHVITCQKAGPGDGGHAFVIVGYDQEGFVIQNSWGTGWGTGGHAVLTYEDWLENAMDCWVAQLGVVTKSHDDIAQSATLRVSNGIVQLASDAALRRREISPFIIDMGNNGLLSNTGAFRTNDADVRALVNDHLTKARETFKLKPNQPVDIAIYAHGGLTSEEAAAETAAKWIPALYDNKIFPIFLMWETDLWSTLKGRLQDIVTGYPRPTSGPLASLTRWWDERLEKLLSVPGSAVWGEMKQNAEAISQEPEEGKPKSGGFQIYEACGKSPHFDNLSKVRLHLIGHSAGSILHCHIVDKLCALGWKFESVNFLAPAVRVDDFKKTMLSPLKNGGVKRLNLFNLSKAAELSDNTCRPILGYGRSLLYLVSQSFEKGREVPILGMEKFIESEIKPLNLRNTKLWLAPGKESQSSTHGGFDDDSVTMQSVISLIRKGTL